MRRWELEEETTKAHDPEPETKAEENISKEKTNIKDTMEERHSDRASMGLLISACIFVIVLVSTITVVCMTMINNKKKVEDAQAKESFLQEESVNQNAVDVDSIEVPEAAIVEEVEQETTDDETEEEVTGKQITTGVINGPALNGSTPALAHYMGFALNHDQLPQYECDPDDYERHSATISNVLYTDEFTDEEAQDIFCSFASYLTLHDVMEDGHVLFITQKDDEGWYTVCDELTDDFYYINVDERLCYKDLEDVDPAHLFPIDRGINRLCGGEKRVTNYTITFLSEEMYYVDCEENNMHYMIYGVAGTPIDGYEMPLDEWRAREESHD